MPSRHRCKQTVGRNQCDWRESWTGEEERKGGDALAGSAGKKEHVRGARAEPGRNLVEGGDAYDWRNGDNVWGGGGEGLGSEGDDWGAGVGVAS